MVYLRYSLCNMLGTASSAQQKQYSCRAADKNPTILTINKFWDRHNNSKYDHHIVIIFYLLFFQVLTIDTILHICVMVYIGTQRTSRGIVTTVLVTE